MRNVNEIENANSRHDDFFTAVSEIESIPLVLVGAPREGMPA
jgi:hypothetical protein